MQVIVNEYYQPQDGANWSPAVARAMEAHPEDGVEYRFLPGNYDFYPAGTATTECWESNNDGGEKQVLFLLRGRRDIRVDGSGSHWMLHGRISPIVVDGCADVTVCGMTVDCQRPFYTEGEILRADDEGMELRIDPAAFPHAVRDGHLVMMGDCWEDDLSHTLPLCQEFSPVTRAPAPHGPTCFIQIGAGDQNLHGLPAGLWRVTAEATAAGTVLLRGDFRHAVRPGNILVMTHERRTNSFLFIKDSSRVTLRDAELYHIGSMGVIAQSSADVTLERFRVIPAPGSGRTISINADATHFVNCSGRVTVRDCVFESMMDDGVNVHGIYTTVTEAQGAAMTVELRHFQQKRVQTYRVGDRITVRDGATMEIKATPVVRSASFTDPTHIRLELDTAVDACPRDVVENADNMPEVLIEGCRMGSNRPRGVVMTSPRHTVIRGNVFRNSSSGVHVAGDPEYWFESGAVDGVEITGNRFEGCNYMDGGFAVVLGGPDLLKFAQPFHRNITVTNNDFRLEGGRGVYACCVEGLTVTHNRVTGSFINEIVGCSRVEMQSAAEE